MNISVPVGPFDRSIFKYALDILKVGAVYDRLMDVFGYLPFAFINIS